MQLIRRILVAGGRARYDSRSRDTTLTAEHAPDGLSITFRAPTDQLRPTLVSLSMNNATPRG
jgi:hypothetical protein